MARLDDQLAALATMSPAQLRAEWMRVHRAPCPALSIDLLTREIAYRLQERARGGLPADARKQIAQLVKQFDRSGEISIAQQTVAKAGTRLVRHWQGRTYHVLVLDTGYLFDERRYRSLSQIARHITGAAWSGPRFFGLKVRSECRTIRRVAA